MIVIRISMEVFLSENRNIKKNAKVNKKRQNLKSIFYLNVSLKCLFISESLLKWIFNECMMGYLITSNLFMEKKYKKNTYYL